MQVSTFFTPVTLADILTSGSAVVGLGNTTGLEAGETVGGIGIPGPGPATPTTPPTTISDVLSVSFIGTLTDGSTTVTNLSTTTGLLAGEEVVGVGIPSGTTIRSVNHLGVQDYPIPPATTSGSNGFLASGVTLSASATVSGTESLSTQGTSEVDQIMGPTGSLMGPQYFPSTSSTGQIIPEATSAGPGVVTSTVTIPSYNGTFTIADLSVELTAAFTSDSDLTAILISPNGTTQVTLFSGVGGNSGLGFMNTVFDDSAESSIATGTAPFTGTYQPANSLSVFNGQTVDMQNPSASSLRVPGVWTLKLINSSTTAEGMLDNWSLNITPNITVSPVPSTESTVGGVLLATQFTVGFPLQQLSGTYTIQMGPTIEDQFGDGLDVTQDAGLAVLRSQIGGLPSTTGTAATVSSTTTEQYSDSIVPPPIATTSGAAITFTGMLSLGSATVTDIASTAGPRVRANGERVLVFPLERRSKAIEQFDRDHAFIGERDLERLGNPHRLWLHSHTKQWIEDGHGHRQHGGAVGWGASDRCRYRVRDDDRGRRQLDEHHALSGRDAKRPANRQYLWHVFVDHRARQF